MKQFNTSYLSLPTNDLNKQRLQNHLWIFKFEILFDHLL